MNYLKDTILRTRIEDFYNIKKENILLIGPDIEFVKNIATKYSIFFLPVQILIKSDN